MVSKIVSSPELSAYHGIYTVRNVASPLPLSLRSALGKARIGGHKYDVESLELSRLGSVRALADAINARVKADELPPIRALILNASYNDMGKENYTEGGFESTFQINYLSQWLLTLKLLGCMDRENGRIVVVGSACHKYTFLFFFLSRWISSRHLLTHLLLLFLDSVNHPMHKVTKYFDDPRYKLHHHHH